MGDIGVPERIRKIAEPIRTPAIEAPVVMPPIWIETPEKQPVVVRR